MQILICIPLGLKTKPASPNQMGEHEAGSNRFPNTPQNISWQMPIRGHVQQVKCSVRLYLVSNNIGTAVILAQNCKLWNILLWG